MLRLQTKLSQLNNDMGHGFKASHNRVSLSFLTHFTFKTPLLTDPFRVQIRFRLQFASVLCQERSMIARNRGVSKQQKLPVSGSKSSDDNNSGEQANKNEAEQSGGSRDLSDEEENEAEPAPGDEEDSSKRQAEGVENANEASALGEESSPP